VAGEVVHRAAPVVGSAAMRPAPMPRRDVRPLYPVDPWQIRELAFDAEHRGRNETIFALSNGHLGLRGNVEEAAGTVVAGTYVNGFYEESPVVYPEPAPAYARFHQVMLNVADGKGIALQVGDDPLDLDTGAVLAYERALDMRTGVVTRAFRWQSPHGAEVRVSAERLVSLTRESIAAIRYRVSAESGSVPVRAVSTIDARVRNRGESDDPRLGSTVSEDALRLVRSEADGPWGVVVQRTASTRLAVVAAADHEVAGPGGGGLERRSSAGGDGTALEVRTRLAPGETLEIVKILAYLTSLDVPEGDLVGAARAAVADARAVGFDGLAAEQRAELDRFWAASDVELEGDVSIQQGVRYNLFSVFQAAGRDGRTSLAAKGLSGEGYEGHYFWDTEVFALPFLAHTQPAIARALIEYRIATLDRARLRAAEMSERGALYPWRTINGDEASAFFPAGTAQYHINAAIALGIRTYVTATGDRDLLLAGGAEVVLETARLWASLGAYSPAHDGAFCIQRVTGPDEYAALVNDNAYTNLMARAHFRYAAGLAAWLEHDHPDSWRDLSTRLDLTPEEVAGWVEAADRIHAPYDARLGVTPQDDGYLGLPEWDFAATPPDAYPLLLHYHPLVLYRHQVLKQPDVVLAQVLLPGDFSTAQKLRNFAYYDPRTTGDSSLAPCIQSVAAVELGQTELAYDYFLRTARMDLDDVNGNAWQGVHIAAMAGTWISLVRGFAGFRDEDGRVEFAPRLPEAWQRLRFRLRLGGSVLEVSLTRDDATYTLVEGEALTLRSHREEVRVGPGAPVTVDLRPRLAAVVFDLDGVLTDSAEHHYRAWRRLAEEESLPFDRELNERLKGVSRMESLEIILDNAGRRPDPAERVRLADRKNAYFRELIAGIGPGDLLPGMGELLAELRRRGVRTAVASMSHNAPEVLDRLGIRPLIDAVVDPATVMVGKPDPEIFLAAAEALGVRPDDCAAIEDAQAGVAAIRAAGMVAVGVGEQLEGAHWRVDDTRLITADALERLVAARGQQDDRGAVAPPVRG
jgi:beta-phosphoglucomutase